MIKWKQILQDKNEIQKKRILRIREDQMLPKCLFYHTRLPNKCECREKVLPNSLYRGNLLCSHFQRCPGIERENSIYEIQSINISIFRDLVLKQKYIIQTNKGPTWKENCKNSWNDTSLHSIKEKKHFPICQGKIQESERVLCNYPVNLFHVISEGIFKFSSY